MRPEDVPTEIVEAAARHRFEMQLTKKYPEITWDGAALQIKDRYLQSAADYLAVALPLYGAEVLRQAAKAARPGEERMADELLDWSSKFDGIHLVGFDD